MGVGYGIGVLGGRLARSVWRMVGRPEASSPSRRGAWWVIGGAGVVVAPLGVVRWTVTQGDQRDLVGMPGVSPMWLLAGTGLAAVLTGLLIFTGRLLGFGIGRLDTLLRRWLPPVGAHGVTAMILAIVAARADAVSWAGPTNSNPILHQPEQGRARGTPVWSPSYEHGGTVRWANRPGDVDPGDPIWESPRVLSYHHPSDPVGYWNWETMWKPREWQRSPVGYDVSPATGWFPFVTWAQGLGDLMAGFSTDPGFGHNYAGDFADGIAAVIAPDGWTPGDTSRLNSALGLAAGAESAGLN